MRTELFSLIILARKRSNLRARELPHALARAVLENVAGSALDWDDWAGEDWARVTLGNEVIAFILAGAPFIVLLEGYASMALTSAIKQCGAILVVARDLESKDYEVDLALLDQAFPGRAWPGSALDPGKVSISDLWWATV